MININEKMILVKAKNCLIFGVFNLNFQFNFEKLSPLSLKAKFAFFLEKVYPLFLKLTKTQQMTDISVFF